MLRPSLLLAGRRIGVAGTDVLDEFRYPEIYAPIDLQLARCRMVVAESRQVARHDDPESSADCYKIPAPDPPPLCGARGASRMHPLVGSG